MAKKKPKHEPEEIPSNDPRFSETDFKIDRKHLGFLLLISVAIPAGLVFYGTSAMAILITLGVAGISTSLNLFLAPFFNLYRSGWTALKAIVLVWVMSQLDVAQVGHYSDWGIFFLFGSFSMFFWPPLLESLQQDKLKAKKTN